MLLLNYCCCCCYCCMLLLPSCCYALLCSWFFVVVVFVIWPVYVTLVANGVATVSILPLVVKRAPKVFPWGMEVRYTFRIQFKHGNCYSSISISLSLALCECLHWTFSNDSVLFSVKHSQLNFLSLLLWLLFFVIHILHHRWGVIVFVHCRHLFRLPQAGIYSF